MSNEREYPVRGDDPRVIGSQALSFTPLDYANKGDAVSLFTLVSGSGSVVYNASGASVIGNGSFDFTGNGTWIINSLFPVSVASGVAGICSYKISSGNGVLSVGYQSYTNAQAAIAIVPSQNYFLLNALTISNTSYIQASGQVRAEGVGNNNLPTGTRFISPIISITSNPSTISIDGFVLTQYLTSGQALAPTIDYFMVGGGGPGGGPGGGIPGGGGGGGAGGILSGTMALSVGTYPIVIGAGGTYLANGSNSTFNGLIALGGGYGADDGFNGQPGGSGGGGGQNGHVGGAGTAGQGFAGGTAGTETGGGGGGAGSVGGGGGSSGGGPGGNGITSSITGAPVYYAAGGGGGGAGPGGEGGGGGIGGDGGDGTNNNGMTAGTVNTGSGGGGVGYNNGAPPANGGSGIVIISYVSGTLTATGGTMLTIGDSTVHIFTSSGNWILTAL
jgi:hypothetical protein